MQLLRPFARRGSGRLSVARLRRMNERRIEDIRRHTDRLQHAATSVLADDYTNLRERVQSGQSVHATETIVATFALMTEAVRRALNKRYYDVQLLAGLVLADGHIAEMQTGEGKTIATGLPAALFALRGNGVHVATTNEYLCERDYAEMQPAFSLLGLSTGLLRDQAANPEKRAAYNCDITYGTGYEFGFDFLRDQLAIRNHPVPAYGRLHRQRLRGQRISAPDVVQRELASVIIDEVDSVLIDEATTPLIISGAPDAKGNDAAVYQEAMRLAGSLQSDIHFQHQPASRSLHLTQAGWLHVHAVFPRALAKSLRRPWAQYVTQALRAEHQLQRDVDYIVRDNRVLLVDQNTGRIHEERSWRAGLHQAVETREQTNVSPETIAQARISRQRYFQFYSGLCGLTGTAADNATEFDEFFQRTVIPIPTHRPCRRITMPAAFFANATTRDRAIVDEIRDRRTAGQPVLVGTRSIAHSNRLSELLQESDLPHTVLNGTQTQDEADIVSRAGASGSVTVATNMAGRGTDIRLNVAAKSAGGLHVVVAGHHESPRVDRQLTGRAARQGDPGSCRFMISADDDLIQTHAPALAKRMQSVADSDGICHVDFSARINQLQTAVDQQGFERRRQMVEHDTWLDSILNSMARQA